MRKKGSSNIFRISGQICFGLAILALVTPGCKKKEAPPPPPVAQVTPLPQRAVQANSSAAKLAPVAAPGAPAAATAPGATPATAPVAAPAKAPSAAPVAAPAKATAAASAKVPAAAPATAPVAAPAKTPAAVIPAAAPAPSPAAAQIPVQKQLSSSRLSPVKVVSLDFSNRRDPFKPFAQAVKPQQQANVGKAARTLRDALPIQRFDVEKFTVSGIVTGVRENSALVIDPTGKGYVVKAGMQLGNNEGRIKRITDSSLEVEESFRDDSGKLRKRLVKLMLIRKK